ncbi:MAG: hypothetical protein KKA42_16315 [candidate division Zixibacteria bacterium]|nr:hypothetical protein [candidate division Zixibacteria bacterium]
MKEFKRNLIVTLALLIAVSLIPGCGGGPKIPIYIDPDLDNMAFETVTLLPIIDRRVDKSEDFPVESSIGDKVDSWLNKKGYEVIRPGAFSDTLVIDNEGVVELEAHELAELGGSDTEYMLVVYLDDASGKTALGYSFKIEMTGLLLSKKTGALLWKDKGIASGGQGGLLGCMMSGAVRGDTMKKGVDLMLKSFPIAPSRRK